MKQYQLHKVTYKKVVSGLQHAFWCVQFSSGLCMSCGL